MAEAQKKISKSTMQVNISGRVTDVQQINGTNGNFYVTQIVIPAADVYQKPQRVQVNSDYPFAKSDEDVNILANVNPRWHNSKGNWYFSCTLWKD